jgi:alpha-glucosidase
MNTRLSQIVVLFLVGCAYGLFSACSSLAAEADSAKEAARIETLLKSLDPFYKQHVVADGLLIVSSEKVAQHALREVAYLARVMLANRPDVLKSFGEERSMYVCVLAYNEMQSQLPECRGQSDWADYRCRGQGGRPISCAEENLLGYPGDPWQGENIFVHEFGHGIHGVLAGMDERFNERLKALHEKAEQSGRFRGYGIQGGPGEFWAEGVQAWFNCNGATRPKCGGGQSSFEVLGPGGEHVCHIRTRAQLKTYLPEFAKLLDESFRQNEWVYVPVAKRLDLPHLRGYDPAKAPTFRFPPEVVERYEALKRLEAERKKDRD